MVAESRQPALARLHILTGGMVDERTPPRTAAF
jgi:hypothetical protein